jgi:hypothetical protein
MATPKRVENTPTGPRAPRIDFDVTAEHIAAAVPRDSGHCMIADALRDAIPDAEFISVDLATIRWTDVNAGYRYIYLTPGAAQAALIDFDQGKTPEPFHIKQNAAQMHLTAGARKARTERNRAIKDETGTWPRQNAELVPPRDGSNSAASVPVKVGGEPLPGPGRAYKRREFGLRRYVR